MQISEAKLRRIFVVRLEDSEKLPDSIQQVARQKKIRSAMVLLLGGARDGKLVVGPDSRRKRHAILTQSFGKGHEIMGIGTIFSGSKGPELHLHTAVGRGRKTLVGCGRTGLKVHFIIEAVILEFTGLAARRVLDPATGFHLLKLGNYSARVTL
jgi:predicted DNA-binding protein with PD1-like motif